jgi:integrase
MADSQYVRSKRFPHLFRFAGSKVWWAFIPVERGRRLRETTRQTDERLAHLWYLERIKADLRPGKPQISLHDALDARRGERRTAGRAEGTIHCLTVKGRALERLLVGESPLSSITAEVVDDYIAVRLKEGTERTTIGKELSTLRGALKLARRNGYECPPVDEVMPLNFSLKYRPKERALSEHEIGLLLGALDEYPKRRAVVAFLLATGATYPSEVQDVRPGDVDQKKWTVHLRGTKRTTRDRYVPVVSFMRPLLGIALPYIPFERWTNVRRDLHEACERAGIAKCSPNDLRRSVATLLRSKGVETSLIGVYLGHRDSRMVERVYGRISADRLGVLLKERLG